VNELAKNRQSARDFVAAWGRSFCQTLAQAGLVSPQVEVLEMTDCREALAQAGPARVLLRLSAPEQTEPLTLVTTEPEALQLAQALRSEPSNRSAEFNQTYRHAATELVRQAADCWISLQGGLGGRPTEITLAAASSGEIEGLLGGVRLSASEFPAVTILFAASATWLVSPSEEAMCPEARFSGRDAGTSPAHLDLLLDVQLDATVRFGERRMLLREILAANPGTVIELDRQLQEPADLLVAGRLIARGEVVVVNGSFGLRITELTSAAPRSQGGAA
jgi:flagellar motor switch protein FliN